MMKKSIAFILLFFNALSSHAQLFFEDFNGGSMPSGWAVNNPDTVFNWAVGSQSGFAVFSNGAAFFDDDNAGPSSANRSARMVSPVINLGSSANPKLSFKYANMVYDLDSSIKVEVFNGTSWVQVFSSSGDSGQWGIDWNTFMYTINSYEEATGIDLTPYANSNFQIRFVYDDAGDYSYGAVIDDVTITDETLITFAPTSPQIYGSNLTLSASSSDASVTQFDFSVVSGPCTVTNGVMTATGVGNCVINAAPAGNTTSAPVQANVEITPAPLTITADNKTGIYGQALPALTVSYGGWVNGDTVASLSTAATASTTATAMSPVGSYPITASGAIVNSNYTISYLAGTLTIEQAAQTLAISSAAPVSAKVGGSYAVTTTPGGSTKPVTLAVTGNCTLSGSTVSFDTVGSCTVTASQKGDDNYLDAADAQTINIVQGGSGVSIGSTPNPSLPGQEVSFTITVALDNTKSLKAQSGLTKAFVVPTGTVTLSDGATTLGTATPLDANGNATVTVKTLTSVGSHSIVATYSGDANFAAVQSATFIQTVSAAPLATPVPLFGELWEKLLLSLMVVGVSALVLRIRRAA